jgi:hypothetical protein
MWPTLLLAVLLLGAGWYWFISTPPLSCKLLIRIRKGACFFSGESVARQQMLDVAEILHESGVQTGFIALTANSRVKFSREIPEAVRQRLRNVLMSS